MLELTTTGGGQGSGVMHKISIDELRRIFDNRVEPENGIVLKRARVLAAD